MQTPGGFTQSSIKQSPPRNCTVKPHPVGCDSLDATILKKYNEDCRLELMSSDCTWCQWLCQPLTRAIFENSTTNQFRRDAVLANSMLFAECMKAVPRDVLELKGLRDEMLLAADLGLGLDAKNGVACFDKLTGRAPEMLALDVAAQLKMSKKVWDALYVKFPDDLDLLHFLRHEGNVDTSIEMSNGFANVGPA